MRNQLIGAVAAAACVYATAAAAVDLPYTQGPVTDVTAVRTKPGKFFEYWAFLNKQFKAEMDEAKKQGIVVSYAVYAATPRSPRDPDLYLVVTYPNMATFDTLDLKMAAIDEKLAGLTPQQADAESGGRDSIREILGDEIIREMKFK